MLASASCQAGPTRVKFTGGHKVTPTPGAKAMSMPDQSKTKPRKMERQTKFPALDLHYIDESNVPKMARGDIFLIGQMESADPRRELAFHAILACPLCGSQILISTAQYSGLTPVICGTLACPGLFKITDRKRIIRLPVS